MVLEFLRLSGADADVTDVERLSGSFTGRTYLTEFWGQKVVIKQRDERRALLATQVMTRVMSRSKYPIQPLVLPVTELQGQWFLGLGWLVGVPLSLTSVQHLGLQDRRQIGVDLIDWLETLQAHKASGAKWSVRADDRVYRKRLQALRLGALSAGEAETVRHAWEQQLHPALTGVTPCLTHRDLHPANILLRERQFLTAIDFEHARVADPLYDLVKVQDFILPLDAELAAGIISALALETWDEEMWARFRAVCVLEYLSAVVYHAKRGEDREVGERLTSLLEACESSSSFRPPLRRAWEGETGPVV